VKIGPVWRRVSTGLSLLTRGRGVLQIDQLPMTFRDLSLGKRLNMVALGLSETLGLSLLKPKPVVLQVEPTNTCNLRCRTCVTGAGLMTRHKQLMDYDLYRRLIDQVRDFVAVVFLWSWGEPFLHPDACRMIRYAKDAGLKVHTSTNGHCFTRQEEAESLVASGLDSLVVAVDGLDQETYAQYRRYGDLGKVLTSIRNVLRARGQTGVSHPFITLRFIVLKHNEHQLEDVRQFARDLGVDAFTIRAGIVQRSGIDSAEDLCPSNPGLRRDTLTRASQNTAVQRNGHCPRPFTNLTVFSNGAVVVCEEDYDASQEVGNIADVRVTELLRSSRRARLARATGIDCGEFSFCRNCTAGGGRISSLNIETVLLGEKRP
jgi:MoaA/NifB/PqqE/SkfB family radical SAM enzyme